MGVRRIAELAGISIGAVSMALNDSPNVSEETRRRVRKIAKSLNYRPNAKLGEFMSHIRAAAPNKATDGCIGVMSFHPTPRPWEASVHHTRIYSGMTTRAEELGYRLESLWLRAPGMTHRRFRSILEARGIQGLICFSSPVDGQAFPTDLDRFAIVTISLTIRTPLHRVTTHFFNDTWTILEKLYELGYRRPGLLIGPNDDHCSGHACTSAYFGWCRHRLGFEQPVPPHIVERLDGNEFAHWFGRHRPDSIVLMHGYDKALPEFNSILRKQGIAVGRDVGVAVGWQILDRAGYSGVQVNQHLMGSWAVELLVNRIMNKDVGIPSNPRVEMIESQWVDGTSLRECAPTQAVAL
ncbi:MAG: LacI family DNA-binding transcriptional regulator [Opitutus sp.]